MQEVNLLSYDLSPRSNRFALRELALACAALAFVLCAYSAWWFIQNSALDRKIESNEKQLVSLERQIELLESQAERPADSKLVQELERVQSERADYLELTVALKEENLNGGFFQHLNDLANTKMRKLWFDNISFSQSGQQIVLSGFSESPELIPLYLSMLSEKQSFSGYQFDGLTIEKKTDALVAFEVSGPQGTISNE